MNVVELEGVQKSYGRRGDKNEILRFAPLQVKPRDFVVIQGPSGCGKSTLLNIIGLLDVPDAGTVKIDGEDVTRAGERTRSRIRNQKIGFVFQHFNLLPSLNAVQNVALPLVVAGVSRSVRLQRARDLLERVGLSEKERRLPTGLSGGEQQRVAIARALVNNPPLLLADEPTGNLDRENTESVIDIFQELHEQAGSAIVLVTHDSGVAKRAKRILRLDESSGRS